MRYALITDHHVEKLYGQSFCNHLSSLGFDIQLFSFPAGEAFKTRATKEKLEDALLSEGFTRDTTIIALGGGVVTDLVGFLASTFCRGVELILVPTTLMGMVDAAIGGKNGVNTEHGKNMIGSMYDPKKLYICPEFLKTLPEDEWFNGAVEMLKAGLIADADYFYNFSEIPIAQSIERAIEIKRRIISKDLTEKGLRRILNAGHTVAHALETLSDYQISHGRAVAAGIVLEAEISYEMGILKKEALDQIKTKFPSAMLSYRGNCKTAAPQKIDGFADETMPEWAGEEEQRKMAPKGRFYGAHEFYNCLYSFEEMYEVMRRDKKAEDGCPRFALLEDIGVPFSAEGAYCVQVPREVLKKVLAETAGINNNL